MTGSNVHLLLVAHLHILPALDFVLHHRLLHLFHSPDVLRHEILDTIHGAEEVVKCLVVLRKSQSGAHMCLLVNNGTADKERPWSRGKCAMFNANAVN